MTIKPAKIRGTHRYSFRKGEWAKIVGVSLVINDGGTTNLCFNILYDDGFVDYMVIDDANNYETKGY